MPSTLEAAETTASARLRGVSAMVWLTMRMLLSLVRCWQQRLARARSPSMTSDTLSPAEQLYQIRPHAAPLRPYNSICCLHEQACSKYSLAATASKQHSMY